MKSVFHWVRVKVICHATEDQNLLYEIMTTLTGLEDLDVDASEGQHGNPIIVMDAELTHNKEIDHLFVELGEGIIEQLLTDLNNRIDENCIFYTRLDKQRAVMGGYSISHGGDVISITGKLVSHPARKEIAMKNMETFLRETLQKIQAPSSE
ncbi:MAG: RNA-binding domain-containing protein [Candidatus Methanomethylophilaceae archaeon]